MTQIEIPCSWIRRINSVTMSILLKAIYRFSTTPIKFTMAFFTELELKQIVLQIAGKQERP